MTELSPSFEMQPRPPDRLQAAQQTADAMIAASQTVLVDGIEKFAHELTPGKLRHAGRTPGGAGIGDEQARAELANEPQQLFEPVRERLVGIIDSSSDEKKKQLNSSRNAEAAKNGEKFWIYGDLVHSTSYLRIGGILEKGLICSELQGVDAKVDTTPLEADLSEIIDANLVGVADATGNEQYNYSADRGSSSSVLIKFRREPGATDYGEESTGNLDESPSHRTVFVGLPSTEVSGIQIVGKNVDTESVVRQVIESGQYMQVFDRDDNLLLTPEAFEQETGSKLQELEVETQETSETLKKLAVQVPRVGSALLRLALQSQAYTEQFAGRVYGSNARYSDRVALGGSNMFITPEGKDKPVKVSIPLSGGRQLHAWGNANGEVSLFTSSLDGESAHVKDSDVASLRAELANVLDTQRQAYAKSRTTKNAEAAMDEEASVFQFG